jgi:hypothetical protein
MMRHVPDESLPDLAEGRGSEADRVHAAACGPCAARVEEAREGLALARRAEVPEPSPLYWEAMRRNVGRRIADESRPSARWGWLVPVASVAMVVAVLALTTGRTHAPSVPPPRTLTAWSALPPAEDDTSLDVLEGLAVVADADLGELDEGRGVTAFLAGLSEDDCRVLADSLRPAGQGGGS